MGSLSLLQWIFLTQESNWVLYPETKYKVFENKLRINLRTSLLGFPYSSVGKESAYNAGDLGSTPGLGRPPGERNGNPLQYSCLESLIDRGAWQATAHGVARVGHDLATKPSPPLGPVGWGNGSPLQYPCLENSMDRGAWWATVHGVAKIGHNWATNTHCWSSV